MEEHITAARQSGAWQGQLVRVVVAVAVVCPGARALQLKFNKGHTPALETPAPQSLRSSQADIEVYEPSKIPNPRLETLAVSGIPI